MRFLVSIVGSPASLHRRRRLPQLTDRSRKLDRRQSRRLRQPRLRIGYINNLRRPGFDASSESIQKRSKQSGLAIPQNIRRLRRRYQRSITIRPRTDRIFLRQRFPRRRIFRAKIIRRSRLAQVPSIKIFCLDICLLNPQREKESNLRFHRGRRLNSPNTFFSASAPSA